MTQPLLEARNVWKSYQLGDTRVDALRGVNFGLHAGEFTVLLGPSGSGKSTLLHLLGAMDRPTQGQVTINGRDISAASSAEQARIRLHEIGFVFQTFNLIPTLNALENISLPMRLAGIGRRERTDRARKLLEMVGLSDRATHQPRQLSGGQRQRVAVARALANEPALILADEPTGNLDSESGDAVISLLRQAQAHGTSVIVVSHNPNLIEPGDTVLSIRDGKIARSTSPPSTATAGAGDDYSSSLSS